MSKNPEKKEKKTKSEETEESISSQEKSNSSEKAQVDQTETTKRFCENSIKNLKDIKIGVLFAGVQNLFDGTKKIDTKITMNANGLLSKVTGYFRNAIDSYEKTSK